MPRSLLLETVLMGDLFKKYIASVVQEDFFRKSEIVMSSIDCNLLTLEAPCWMTSVHTR